MTLARHSLPLLLVLTKPYMWEAPLARLVLPMEQTGRFYLFHTTETSAYDAVGNRTNSVDQLNRTTTYIYDALNRLIETIYPDGSTNGTVYDDVGRVSQTIDARGTITANAYDAAGRRIAVTNAFNISGIASSNLYTYDSNGNQITFTDANGHTTTNVYDVLNRQVQVQYPDGTTTETVYDGDGRSIIQTNQDGFPTYFTYDGAGRLIAVTNALNQVTRYQYDEAGNEILQVDALNRENIFTYDSMGRKILHTMPGGQSEGFAYDLDGNQVYHTNFNGAIIADLYDSMNRQIARTYPNGTSNTFTYTLTGQRATMNDASGSYAYAYDSRDRMLTNAGPAGILSYSYDVNGNLAAITSSTANGTSVTYQYDPLNRLTNVIDGRLSGVPQNTVYHFDPAGNLQGIAYPNTITNLYQYDSLNRLTSLVWKAGNTSLGTFAYTLGATGNRTALSETVSTASRSYTWQYDRLYRLTNEIVSGTAPTGNLFYQYDSVGNRTNRTSGLGLMSQSLSYNTDDQLTTDTYDNNGNTTVSGGINYKFDYENRLTNYNNGQVVFVYDTDGNRVKKITSTATTLYLVDDENPSGCAQVLEELTVSGITTNLSKAYTYGLDLISQRQPGTSTNFFGYDGHGSTRFLTDLNGSIIDTYVYDALGNLVNSSGSTANNYLYCGQQWDPDIGQYYLRARTYYPPTGRFWTQDGDYGNNEDPLSLHKYLYAADDPVNKSDPSGNDYGDFRLSLGTILGSALFNVPGLSAAAPNVVSTDGTCGPEVTAAVMLTMQDIRETYQNSPFSKRAKAAFYTPFGMGDGWDIKQLFYLGFGAATASQFGKNCSLGTGEGADTVQFSFGGQEKVYDAGAVNYVLWGEMFSLLYNDPELTLLEGPAIRENYSQAAAVSYARTYKAVKWHDWGITAKEAGAFVKYGYSGTDPSSTALPLATNPGNLAASQRFPWKYRGISDDYR